MKVLLTFVLSFLTTTQFSFSIESYDNFKQRVNEQICKSDKVNDEIMEKYIKCNDKLYHDDLQIERKKEHNRAVDECMTTLSAKTSTYSGITQKSGKYILMTHCLIDEYHQCYDQKIKQYFNEWLNDTMSEFKPMRNCQLSAVGAQLLAQ